LTYQVHTATSVPESLASKSIKTITYPIHWISPQQLFSLSKSEVRAGRPLTITGQLEDKLGRGHADYHQRWVCHRLLGSGLSAATGAFGSALYFEKSWEINTFLTQITVHLLKSSNLILVPPRRYKKILLYKLLQMSVTLCKKNLHYLDCLSLL
jgi:hypothetical protein